LNFLLEKLPLVFLNAFKKFFGNQDVDIKKIDYNSAGIDLMLSLIIREAERERTVE